MLTAQQTINQPQHHFDGATYHHTLDGKRLNKQYLDTFDLMRDGNWRTLSEIEAATGYPQASVSARLRDMRKAKFGGHAVNRRRSGMGGLFEYQLVVRIGEAEAGDLFGEAG